MYTNDDYKNYLNQLLEIEVTMKDNVEELITYMSDKDIIKSLNIILSDEINHKNLLEEILDILAGKER